MKTEDAVLLLSATDLSTYSACQHATLLDREAAHGRLVRPHRNDPTLDLLQQRGREHEERFKAHLEKEKGEAVTRIAGAIPKTREEWLEGNARTLAAMRLGKRVLYQAPLARGDWTG